MYSHSRWLFPDQTLGMNKYSRNHLINNLQTLPEKVLVLLQEMQTSTKWRQLIFFQNDNWQKTGARIPLIACCQKLDSKHSVLINSGYSWTVLPHSSDLSLATALNPSCTLLCAFLGLLNVLAQLTLKHIVFKGWIKLLELHIHKHNFVIVEKQSRQKSWQLAQP